MGFVKKLKKGHKNVNVLAGTKLDPDAPLGAPSAMDALAGMTGESAAEAAAEIEAIKNQYYGLQEKAQREEFDRYMEQQRPYIEAGIAQLPDIQSSATTGGYLSSIEQLLGDRGMADIRQAEINKYMPNVNRDISSLGDNTIDQAIAAEDMLNQRRQSLAGLGLTSSTASAAQGQNNANALSQMLSDRGDSAYNNAAFMAQANTAGANNIASLLGSGGAYFNQMQSGGSNYRPVSQPYPQNDYSGYA